MFKTLTNLFRQLHQDDTGAVIATEYLALGTIVGLGSIAGLSAMRDATTNEMAEYGNSIRTMRQQYQVQGFKTNGSSTSGSAATNSVGSSLGCFGQ